MGGTGQVLVSGSINSSSDELSTSLSSLVKNYRSSTRDLQRSRNTRSAPRYAHLVDPRPGKGDDSRSSSRTAAKLNECKAIAYWANTDEKIAETTVDNNTYSFTDEQIAPGKTYKVVAECQYEGQTVKLSSYATSATQGETAKVNNINPKTTAISSFIKKALVKAISTALASFTFLSDTFKEQIKETVMKSIGPLIETVAMSVSKQIDDGALEFPDDPLKVTQLEEASSSTKMSDVKDASAETELNASIESAQNEEDWEVPPTLDSELAGSAAQGAKDAFCEEGYSPAATDYQIRQAEIRNCAKTFAEVFVNTFKWTLRVPVNDQNNPAALWGKTTCDSAGLGFDDSTHKYQLTDECEISSRSLAENRNYESHHSHHNKLGSYEIYKIAQFAKEGRRYSLEDIDNILFQYTKNSQGSSVGGGACGRLCRARRP